MRRAQWGYTDPDGMLIPKYVIRLSDPPTASERLQLAAAHLSRAPFAIVPASCKTVDEWMAKSWVNGWPSIGAL